jgi:hypothetical protein
MRVVDRAEVEGSPYKGGRGLSSRDLIYLITRYGKENEAGNTLRTGWVETEERRAARAADLPEYYVQV